MSAISEKVGVAIYTKLNVANVTNLATGGVWQDEIPEPQTFPVVVFQRVAPKDVLFALGNNLVGEDDLWLIKAMTELDSSASVSPGELGQLILTAAETAIGTSLTVSGQTVRFVRRHSDIPPFRDPRADRRIWIQGFYLRVFTE